MVLCELGFSNLHLCLYLNENWFWNGSKTEKGKRKQIFYYCCVQIPAFQAVTSILWTGNGIVLASPYYSIIKHNIMFHSANVQLGADVNLFSARKGKLCIFERKTLLLPEALYNCQRVKVNCKEVRTIKLQHSPKSIKHEPLFSLQCWRQKKDGK